MSGARILVTGAASGIGLAVGRLALGEGARVALADRDADGLRAAWGDAARGQDAILLPMDVTEPTSVMEGFETAAQHWGAPPTAVVNAAGVYRIEPTLGMAVDRWDEVMAVNVTGSLLVAQAAARLWAEARVPGSVVLVSSIAHERGDRDEPGAHYAASKGAVVSLCRQLAVEWGPIGIRVNAVSPGVIDTPMLRLGDDPQRMAAYLESAVPLGRLGRADEVAQACWFLASDRSSYVSGAVLAVDGGAAAS